MGSMIGVLITVYIIAGLVVVEKIRKPEESYGIGPLVYYGGRVAVLFFWPVYLIGHIMLEG